MHLEMHPLSRLRRQLPRRGSRDLLPPLWGKSRVAGKGVYWVAEPPDQLLCEAKLYGKA